VEQIAVSHARNQFAFMYRVFFASGIDRARARLELRRSPSVFVEVGVLRVQIERAADCGA